MLIIVFFQNIQVPKIGNKSGCVVVCHFFYNYGSSGSLDVTGVQLPPTLGIMAHGERLGDQGGP